MTINAWGSDDPAEVAKGGTGNATLTDHGVLLGSGTSPVTVTSVGTNGQLLIGASGADPAFASLTSSGGTIDITPGANTLNIDTNAAVAIQYDTDSGSAVPSAGILNIVGASGISTSGSGNTVTITGSGGVGAWTLLATTTVSTPTAMVDFDNTIINGTYDFYAILYDGCRPVNNSVQFRMLVSNDNGSTFHSTNYSGYNAVFTGAFGSSGQITTAMPLSQNSMSNNASFQGASGWGLLSYPSDASKITTWFGNGTNWQGAVQAGFVNNSIYKTAEATDAIRFVMSTGNIATGIIKIYGI